MAAVLVYGLTGSPTPDRIGAGEAIVGALLALSVGFPRACMALLPPAHGALWEKAGWLLMVYGLTLPTALGIAGGHDPGLVIRDIIPFFFVLLPVLSAMRPDQQGRMGLTVCVGAAGLFFALRLIVPSFIEHGRIGFSALPDEDPMYLANAPTVLFAAILCTALAGQCLMKQPFIKNYAWVGCFGIVSMICFMAMAASSQRATLGLAALCLGLLWAISFAKNPVRALIPLTLVLCAAAVLFQPMSNLVQHLLVKTSQVGFNNRLQEAEIVFDMVGDHWGSVLFGLGWGQTVASPAVGGVTVNYTHTMMTALWLKTGLIGVVLTGFYLYGLAVQLWRILWRHPALALAIAAPCLIDVTLYASYKSLDFGLVLLLIPLWANDVAKVAPEAAVVYSGHSSVLDDGS
jgi:hypothetical protein